MINKIKLKPCPFCGTLPDTWWDITQPHKEGFNITCPQCEIPTVHQVFKKEAIEVWNDRLYISQNYIPKERVLTDSYVSDIIYATTQYLDIPDKDLAILNANIEKALLEAQENKEKEIDSLDKS